MCCPGFPDSKKRGLLNTLSVEFVTEVFTWFQTALSQRSEMLPCLQGLDGAQGAPVGKGQTSVCQPCWDMACTSQDTFSVGVLGALGSSTRTRGIHQIHRGKQQPTLTSPEQQQQHKRLKRKHPHSTQILQVLSGFTKFCLNCPGYLFSLL